MEKLTLFFEKHYKAIFGILALGFIAYLIYNKQAKKAKTKREEEAAAEALKKVVVDPKTGREVDISALATGIYNAIFETTFGVWSGDKEKVNAAIAACKVKEVYKLVQKAYAAMYLKGDCWSVNFSVHCYQTGSIEGDVLKIFGETEFINTAINALQ
jgi:hypothetical protein